MKTQQRLSMVFATLFTDMLTISSAYADGNISLFYGLKSLKQAEWKPVEDQQELGILFDFNVADLPVNIAIDYFKSDDTGQSLGATWDGKTTELNIGVRQYLDKNEDWELVPYLGGGIAFIEATFSGIDLSQTDDAASFWVNLGMNWMLGKQFHIGADLRLSSADITLFGAEVDAGGRHLGVTAGVSF